MLDAALEYAARCWPVFPLEPGGKRPLGRLVTHGLKDATTDLERIRAWWTAEPNANIGLVTGVHFDVLDVDGDEGWRSLAHAVTKRGCLPSSPVSLTPGGGAHYLFAPAGLSNRAGILPSLDWRGRAGYVVAPPSIGANGVRYEWAISPDEQVIESAPPWLGELVSRRTVSAPQVAQRDTLGSYGRKALEGEVGRVLLAPQGTRNDVLNRAADSLGQLVAARQLARR